jgi:DNA-binding transcriptional regulator YhcF (GntR family)
VLVDEGILYKKRGLGMFVSAGAKKKILEKRRNSFYEEYVQSLLEEAAKLEISKEDIVKMIVGGSKIEDNSNKGSK